MDPPFTMTTFVRRAHGRDTPRAPKEYVPAPAQDGEPHVLARQRPYRIGDRRRRRTALDSKSRRKGLLGRDTLADRHALVLAPCGSVHTFGMRFPIDVLFVVPMAA